MSALTEYMKAVRVEMKHVTWPSRNQAIAYTALVIGISFFIAFFLGAFDYFFTFLLGKIILLKP